LNLHSRGFSATQTQTIVAQADFDGIAERSDGHHLDILAFEEAHFQQALNERIVALERLDAAALADAQLIQGEHERRNLSGQAGSGDSPGGTHNDLRRAIAAQTQPTAADFQEARAAGLQDFDERARPDAKFGQPADPARLARDLDNLRPLSGMQVVQR
jgi:hypothetical protein